VPRALAMRRVIVPARDRARYLEALARRKRIFDRAGCNFWVFEEAEITGAFVEFGEGKSRDALGAALAAAADADAAVGPSDPRRLPIYIEVPLE
jgi:hypothetical protein